jgi:hypothetical protein
MSVISQYKYAHKSEWIDWKDLGTFESYKNALQVLQIKINRWENNGECTKIDSLNIKFTGFPFSCEFRFYDTINKIVLTGESPWAIGLNEQ